MKEFVSEISNGYLLLNLLPLLCDKMAPVSERSPSFVVQRKHARSDKTECRINGTLLYF